MTGDWTQSVPSRTPPPPVKEVLVSHALSTTSHSSSPCFYASPCPTSSKNLRTLKVPWTLFTRGGDSKSNNLGQAQAGPEVCRTAHTRISTHTSKHTHEGIVNKGQALRRPLHAP